MWRLMVVGVGGGATGAWCAVERARRRRAPRDGAPTRLRGNRLRLAAVALVAGLLAYAGLYAAGTSALESAIASSAGGSMRRGVLGEVDSDIALAAMMPGSRPAALGAAAVRFELYGAHTPAGRAQAITSAELADGCAGRIQAERELGDVAPAAADAARCDLPGLAVEPLLWLGRYAEAATAQDRVDPAAPATNEAITAYVGAGRWAAAADAVDRWLAHVVARDAEIAARSGDAVSRSDLEPERRLRCAGELFRAWSGRADAVARLGNLASDERSGACRLAAALAVPGNQQRIALASAAESIAKDDEADLELIDALTGWPEPGRHAWSDLFQRAAPRLAGSQDAAAVWLALQPQTEPPTIGRLEATAVVAMYRNDLSAATHAVDEAAALLALPSSAPADDNDRRPERRARRRQRVSDEVANLRGALALHGAELRIDHVPSSLLADEQALRTGLPVEHPTSLFAAGCAGDLPAALASAAGEPLAVMIGACGLGGRFEALRAILPRVTTGREALAVAATNLRSGDRLGGDRVPFGILSTASLLRDIHNLLGNAGDAAEWQAVIDRHVAVLEDRRRAIALAFLAAN